jgi:hypothetical protein
MHHRLRRHATLLALCAVLLRGLIPLGWMPSAAAGGLALCTADGMVQLSPAEASELLEQPAPPPEHGESPSDDGHMVATPCAFAVAGTLACVTAALTLPDASAAVRAPDTPYTAPFLVSRPAGDSPARAPPLA